MAKKLFVVWLLITMVTFSSISIYAAEVTPGDFFIPKTPLAMLDEELTARSEEKEESRTAKNPPEEVEITKAVCLTAVRKEDERYLKGLSAYIRYINRNVGEAEAMEMAESFVRYADRYKVDEKVVMAIAQNESTFYADAVSCEDFKGLMQTGDGIAETAGYSPQQLFDPSVSIKVGAKYFSLKLKEFGDTALALTAYNQGSGSVYSGNYSLGYAQLAMGRVEQIETFLEENGYIE